VFDFRLPPPCILDLHSSGILRAVEWYLVTEVSGQPICPIFKDQAIQEALKMGLIGCPETSVTINLHCVTSQKGENLILCVV
jgi:hypothetical protein